MTRIQPKVNIGVFPPKFYLYCKVQIIVNFTHVAENAFEKQGNRTTGLGSEIKSLSKDLIHSHQVLETIVEKELRGGKHHKYLMTARK